ncbi:MAG: TatD family hydrolase [Thermomicrobium sp.]|uniref:TatD family hydrolase n=2 Tax=Thermomicrobium sp. TaxID=1969469 RepID=UPI001B0EAAFC|nr:TatD family hydrolase [Thermomicrobium sp.]MBO9350193.1 TatD family hydrolase [Thermomicrobium sp.]
MILVDTHCHLDLPDFDNDRPLVIERARDAGVQGFVLIAFSPTRWEAALTLAEATPGMVVALGIHPNEADRYDTQVEQRLRQLARHPLVRAIGEIGLDFHWKTTDAKTQERAFRRQIALARELNLPIVLHQREALHELLAILEDADPPHRGVMHCFTGDPADATRFLELGLHLGIGGIVTYRSAPDLRHAVQILPADRMVLETDAPYLAPVPYRGRRNEPAFLRATVATIAELRRQTEDEVARATTRNAVALFRIPLSIE